jgi:cytochrome b561
MRIPQSTKYRPSTIALHWLTLLLLAGVYACMELRGNFPRGSEARGLMKDWHYWLGMSVFALTWLRLALRIGHKAPPIVPQPPAWQAWIARVVALLLYTFLLAMPVLGYLALNAEGEAVMLGGFEFPRLVAENPAFAHNVKEIHETIGTAGYFLIGLHALAALVHHYIQRDNTLRRMLLRG